MSAFDDVMGHENSLFLDVALVISAAPGLQERCVDVDEPVCSPFIDVDSNYIGANI